MPQTSTEKTTPRQQWLNKEKSLKIKFFIILFLTHSLWPLVLGLSEPPQKEHFTPQPTESGHQILKVPAQIFTRTPLPESKIEISIIIDQHTMIKKAYLRSIEHDSLSPSGIKATIEIANHHMNNIKKNGDKIWHIYPPIPTIRSRKGSAYEVSI